MWVNRNYDHSFFWQLYPSWKKTWQLYPFYFVFVSVIVNASRTYWRFSNRWICTEKRENLKVFMVLWRSRFSENLFHSVVLLARLIQIGESQIGISNKWICTEKRENLKVFMVLWRSRLSENLFHSVALLARLIQFGRSSIYTSCIEYAS